MAVYQHISCRPFLGHIYQRSVDRAISVGMIFTHGIADDTGTLTVRFVRTVVQFDHGEQDSPLNRF